MEVIPHVVSQIRQDAPTAAAGAAAGRLGRLGAAVDLLGQEHVLAVLGPVARPLPQHLRLQRWRLHLDVAVVEDLLAHILLDGAVDRPALVVPIHLAGVLVPQVEEVHLAADAAVVALLGLFQTAQVLVEGLLVEEADAVEARQLVGVGVAMPIGAGHRHHLVVLQQARRRHMRTGAEIFEVGTGRAGGVERQRRRALGQGALGVVGLVEVALRAGQAGGGVAVDAGEGPVGGADLRHLGLDGREVVAGHRPRRGHVVIEPVIEGRAVGQAGARQQAADRLGQHMRARMAQQAQGGRVVIAAGEDADLRIAVETGGEVAHLAVDLDGDGLLGQARAYGQGDVAARDRARERQAFAVGEREVGHGILGWGWGGGTARIDDGPGTPAGAPAPARFSGPIRPEEFVPSTAWGGRLAGRAGGATGVPGSLAAAYTPICCRRYCRGLIPKCRRNRRLK